MPAITDAPCPRGYDPRLHSMATGMLPPPAPLLLDAGRLDRPTTHVSHAPFDFLVAPDVLDAGWRDALVADFPRYGSAGFFPYRDADCGPAVRALVDALRAPAFADALGERLGVHGLGARPTLVTLSDSVHRRHGTLHTDSTSKLATALLYLNPAWPHGSAGCLRFLRGGDDIEAIVAPQIPPLYGTLVAFRRADNSWHGHLPFEGGRKVVQVAWLTSDAELRRKARRGGFSRLVKKLAGALDTRLGAGRGVNARHD